MTPEIRSEVVSFADQLREVTLFGLFVGLRPGSSSLSERVAIEAEITTRLRLTTDERDQALSELSALQSENTRLRAERPTFTAEDVVALRGVADLTDQQSANLAEAPYAFSGVQRQNIIAQAAVLSGHLRDIASRLAALLPPPQP